MNIRKIQRLGSSSLIITLPKTWVKRTGIRPGDNVYIIERENELILIPFVSEEPLGPPIIVDAKNKTIQELANILRCLIKNGFKNIIITNESGIDDEDIEAIKKEISKYSAYTIKREEATKIRLTGSIESGDPGQILRETISTVAHTIEILTSMINGEDTKLDEIKEKERTVAENHLKITTRLLGNLDLVKGELLEERRRALTLYLYETAWHILASLQESILGLILSKKDITVTNKEEKEAVLYYIKMLESALWETIGGITNESGKRLVTAENLIEDSEKYYKEKIASLSFTNNALGEIVGIFSYLSILLKNLVKDAKCLIYYSSVTME